jgi:hypothetical protein
VRAESLKSEVRQLANKLLNVVGKAGGQSIGGQGPPSLSQSQQSFGYPHYGPGAPGYSLETSYNPDDYDNEDIGVGVGAYPGLDDLHLDDLPDTHGGGDVNASDMSGLYDYKASGRSTGQAQGPSQSQVQVQVQGQYNGDTNGQGKQQKQQNLNHKGDSEFSIEAPLSVDNEEFDGAIASHGPNAPAPPTTSTSGAGTGSGHAPAQGQGCQGSKQKKAAGGQKKKKDKDRTTLPKI